MDADTFKWKTEASVGGARLTLRAVSDDDGTVLVFDSVTVGGERSVPLTLEESGFLADALPGAVAAADGWSRPEGDTPEREGADGPAVLWDTDAELGETMARLSVAVTETEPELFFHSAQPGQGLNVMPLSRDESRFLAQSLPGAVGGLERWVERREAQLEAEWARQPIHTWADVEPGRWPDVGRTVRPASPAPRQERSRRTAPQANQLAEARRRRAEAVREYGAAARQLACLVTERVHADNPVHGLDLESELLRALSRSGPLLAEGRELPEAREIAQARASADLRVRLVTEIESGNAFAAETARFQGEPFFVLSERREEWRLRHAKEAPLLNGGDVEPTRLEKLAAAVRANAADAKDRLLGKAMAKALEYGSPPLEAEDLKRERQEIIKIMAADEGLAPDRRKEIAERLYRAFSATEIRAMAGQPQGRVTAAFRAAHGQDSERIAASIADLHGERIGTPAPWHGLYEALGASLQPERSRGAGLSAAAA